MAVPIQKDRSHLFAGLIALCVAAIALFAAERILVHLEHVTATSTAPLDRTKLIAKTSRAKPTDSGKTANDSRVQWTSRSWISRQGFPERR